MFANIVSCTERTATRVCWEQWRVLKGQGATLDAPFTRSVIDPEALVLTSLCLRTTERRFDDAMSWWSQLGAHLMSVQRLRSMRSAFPDNALDHGVQWFAASATDAGDARWNRLRSGLELEPRSRAEKGPEALHLLAPATLMLRLRAGFGVGAKADFLAYLVGAHSTWPEIGLWTTSTYIAQSVHYSPASVSRAGSEMALAGLVMLRAGRPTRYELDLDAWAHLLQFDRETDGTRRSWNFRDSKSMSGFPHWRDWGNMLPFLMSARELGRRVVVDELPVVVAASLARDLVEEYQPMLNTLGIATPAPGRFVGERYAEAFADLLTRTCAVVEGE